MLTYLIIYICAKGFFFMLLFFRFFIYKKIIFPQHIALTVNLSVNNAQPILGENLTFICKTNVSQDTTITSWRLYKDRTIVQTKKINTFNVLITELNSNNFSCQVVSNWSIEVDSTEIMLDTRGILIISVYYSFRTS